MTPDYTAGRLLALLAEVYGLPVHDPRLLSRARADLDHAQRLQDGKARILLTPDMTVAA